MQDNQGGSLKSKHVPNYAKLLKKGDEPVQVVSTGQLAKAITDARMMVKLQQKERKKKKKQERKLKKSKGKAFVISPTTLKVTAAVSARMPNKKLTAAPISKKGLKRAASVAAMMVDRRAEERKVAQLEQEVKLASDMALEMKKEGVNVESESESGSDDDDDDGSADAADDDDDNDDDDDDDDDSDSDDDFNSDAEDVEGVDANIPDRGIMWNEKTHMWDEKVDALEWKEVMLTYLKGESCGTRRRRSGM